MPFSDADIRRQMRLGEDSIWEFKQIESMFSDRIEIQSPGARQASTCTRPPFP